MDPRWSLVVVATLCVPLSLAGCATPRNVPLDPDLVREAGVSDAGAGEAGGSDAGGSDAGAGDAGAGDAGGGSDVPAVADTGQTVDAPGGGATDGSPSCDGGKCLLPCQSGFHQCGNDCVSNTSPASCGASCTPAECCNDSHCPKQGDKPGLCVQGHCMAGPCPPGSNDCGGNSCKPCCSQCCSSAMCTAGTGGKVGSCVGGVCDYKCPAPSKDCNGTCLACCTPCCNNSMCSKFGDKPGICNLAGTCEPGPCPAGSHDCGGNSCKECCPNDNGNPCGTGQKTCENGVCALHCGNGEWACGDVCKLTTELCNGKCITDLACGPGRICDPSGTCVLNCGLVDQGSCCVTPKNTCAAGLRCLCDRDMCNKPRAENDSCDCEEYCDPTLHCEMDPSSPKYQTCIKTTPKMSLSCCG